jgi:hypothetical protein
MPGITRRAAASEEIHEPSLPYPIRSALGRHHDSSGRNRARRSAHPAAAAVETQSTVQPTQIVRPDSMPSAGASSQPNDTVFVSPFRREAWGLSEAEWQRYLALMQGIRGAISPKTLSPIEVLGIHAETEAERRNYARRFARLMREEDAERLLAFQRAYDHDCVALFCETFWDFQVTQRSQKWATRDGLRRPGRPNRKRRFNRDLPRSSGPDPTRGPDTARR